MIDIKLYNCNADNRLVDKTNKMTLVNDFANCVIKNTTSIMNISITFKMTNIDDIKNANYVFIPSLNNYYYIDDFIFENNNIATIKCHEDVLMSNKEKILALTCTIARNENKKNGYLVDNEYKTLAYEEIITKGFPSGLDGYSTIIMTVG